ncbi:hypothetical protein A9K58_00250 [Stenotrophomonas maltophilia]|uniref:Uncharacterized protein n=1 Tax=Stenotrophomonas maltophilia TaxID=40324 RepID=A0A1A6Y5F3_STEMA|nr:hypothetical protein [Stenotrophomonas maltophilia]OBU70418.1 hypothetical protein A9K58_00250 [Stenotrophomonas maltophilia]
MKNGDMPVVPLVNTLGAAHAPSSAGLAPGAASGLTKRELIAAMALQGLLAGGWDHAGVPREGAETAVAYADYLLDAMERTP